MTGVDHLGLFIVAGLLLNLTPGPDVLYVVANGLRRGRRAGVVAALGITAGCFVHITAAAIGLSALVAASATAFNVLKWLGAAYLLYVGATLLLSRQGAESARNAPGLIADSEDPARATGTKSLKSVFVQGFWTNALNPKVALFFLAFLPQFIAPGAPHKTQAFVLLGLLFNFNGLWVNIGWALCAAWLARRVAAVQHGMHWLQRAAGVMFIGFGLRLALSDNPSV
ncbi:LysE family translocator [Rhodoferax sediminis]|uniref:LysE family translocator n=1 Tax=Rhodoferax sediminis TaxID=2509614 RepID=A0A515D6S4_9BURK|nr:LysE family translocator [Rhodoferax sediminis]QDL36104.1 LysE family translocator [Rhodoferax sediminis]